MWIEDDDATGLATVGISDTAARAREGEKGWNEVKDKQRGVVDLFIWKGKQAFFGDTGTECMQYDRQV